eukprot:TRINITY_DN16990_c0_g3_i1.p1 TRINITY_DN16990_c0_g3~~TRINITY_DN16990_c0_g3_i1.p1  ORF type:complete len:656 (-),score=54.86 TRINITY_DN16990_c0_g3_i1:190-2157(-)
MPVIGVKDGLKVIGRRPSGLRVVRSDSHPPVRALSLGLGQHVTISAEELEIIGRPVAVQHRVGRRPSVPDPSPLSPRAAGRKVTELATWLNEVDVSIEERELLRSAVGLPNEAADDEIPGNHEARDVRSALSQALSHDASLPHSFRQRLMSCETVSDLSSRIDWHRLVALESVDALKRTTEFGENGLCLDVNSGGFVYFGVLSPLPGDHREEGVVLKLCDSRHTLQSELLASELGNSLGIRSPKSRLLFKAHDAAEWQDLDVVAGHHCPSLHEAMQSSDVLLLLQYIPGCDLAKEEDAWKAHNLTASCHALGRLLVLDILLGNSDRLPVKSLGWRGNPANVLWSCGSATDVEHGNCVPIDAVVARRPPKRLVQDADEKIGVMLGCVFRDVERATDILLQVVSCNPSAGAAIRESHENSGDDSETSAVVAFQEGMNTALDLVLQERTLLDMVVQVVRSWFDVLHEDLRSVVRQNAGKRMDIARETMQLRRFNQEAASNIDVKNRLASWERLFQEKLVALKTAISAWRAEHAMSPGVTFSGFLGDGVLNPTIDAYELLVRLQQLVARAQVMADSIAATSRSVRVSEDQINFSMPTSFASLEVANSPRHREGIICDVCGLVVGMTPAALSAHKKLKHARSLPVGLLPAPSPRDCPPLA